MDTPAVAATAETKYHRSTINLNLTSEGEMTVKNETAGQAEVSRWVDEALIIRVVNTFFRALDEKDFDDSCFRQILAADAQVTRPNGAAAVGPANIVDSFARSFPASTPPNTFSPVTMWTWTVILLPFGLTWSPSISGMIAPSRRACSTAHSQPVASSPRLCDAFQTAGVFQNGDARHLACWLLRGHATDAMMRRRDVSSSTIHECGQPLNPGRNAQGRDVAEWRRGFQLPASWQIAG